MLDATSGESPYVRQRQENIFPNQKVNLFRFYLLSRFYLDVIGCPFVDGQVIIDFLLITNSKRR